MEAPIECHFCGKKRDKDHDLIECYEKICQLADENIRRENLEELND